VSVEGPEQVDPLNPSHRVEAETMAWSEGIKTRFETEWKGGFDWARGKKIADRLSVYRHPLWHND
jgi:arabinoxylan arabinofuranohydrolase